jgi:hypothetical protein
MGCRRAGAALILAALAAAGCTRPHAAFVPADSPAGTATAGPAAVVIEQPAPGVKVSSPVTLAGAVRRPPGYTVAAQVLCCRTDPTLAWRGNAPLVVAPDGRFTGSVPYTLAADGDGVVEVMVVEPASGTVVERGSVAVTLAASP